jgi:hypothetical protein
LETIETALMLNFTSGEGLDASPRFYLDFFVILLGVFTSSFFFFGVPLRVAGYALLLLADLRSYVLLKRLLLLTISLRGIRFYPSRRVGIFNKKETVETALMLSLPLGRRMAAPCRKSCFLLHNLSLNFPLISIQFFFLFSINYS